MLMNGETRALLRGWNVSVVTNELSAGRRAHFLQIRSVTVSILIFLFSFVSFSLQRNEYGFIAFGANTLEKG